MDRRKILIADDEADIKRLVKSALGTDYMGALSDNLT